MYDLSNVLAEGAADVGSTVRIAPPSAVRARGDRRRTALTATSAATVFALAAAGAGAAFAGGGLSTSPATGPPPQTAIPAALKLPHEGEQGWKRSNSPDTASPFTGCGSGDPTLRGRTATRTMTGYFYRDPKVPTEKYTEQFFLFRSERAAREAMAALREGVKRCGWSSLYTLSDWQLHGEYVVGDYPLAAVQDVMGVRLGNAIYLTYHKGTFGLWLGIHPTQEDVAYMIGHVCAVMRLCPPAPHGSPTPTGFPWPGGTGGPPGTPQPSGPVVPTPGSPPPGYPTPHPTMSGPAPTISATPWPTPTLTPRPPTPLPTPTR